MDSTSPAQKVELCPGFSPSLTVCFSTKEERYNAQKQLERCQISFERLPYKSEISLCEDTSEQSFWVLDLKKDTLWATIQCRIQEFFRFTGFLPRDDMSTQGNAHHILLKQKTATIWLDKLINTRGRRKDRFVSAFPAGGCPHCGVISAHAVVRPPKGSYTKPRCADCDTKDITEWCHKYAVQMRCSGLLDRYTADELKDVDWTLPTSRRKHMEKVSISGFVRTFIQAKGVKLICGAPIEKLLKSFDSHVKGLVCSRIWEARVRALLRVSLSHSYTQEDEMISHIGQLDTGDWTPQYAPFMAELDPHIDLLKQKIRGARKNRVGSHISQGCETYS